MSFDRIKKIGRTVNVPILENFGPTTMTPTTVVRHKSLSIPTEDDNVFNAANMEKGGHKDRHLDQTAATSDSGDVSPANMPTIVDADDKKASNKLADMFHSLATRRGLVKSKIAAGDSSPETAQKLMSLNARMANVGGLKDAAKRFED